MNSPEVLVFWIAGWVMTCSFLICITLGVTRLLTSAAHRSLLWTSCFIIMGLAPLLSSAAPKPAFLNIRWQFGKELFEAKLPEADSPLARSGLVESVEVPPVFAPGLVSQSPSLSIGRTWPVLVLLLLALNSLIFLGLIIRSWFQMSNLSARATPAGRRARGAVAMVARQMKVMRPVVLKLTDDLPVPATFGFFRPVLLLPRQHAKDFCSVSMRGILAHELAHIHRCDYLRNLLAQIVSALLWFVPPVWLARREFRKSIELSCDDIAILEVGDRVVYADSLGALALMFKSFPACGLSFADSRPTILLRIRSALFNEHRQRAVSLRGRIAVTIVAISILSVFAFASVGRIEETPNTEMVGADSVVTIHFPTDFSIGELHHRRYRSNPVVAAQGSVDVNLRGGVTLSTQSRFIDQVLALAPCERRVIRGIALSWSSPDAATLARLSELTTLRELDLSNTGIGDSEIRVLRKMTWLRRLRLDRTNITDVGLEQLRAHLPQCDISLPGHSIEALISLGGRSAVNWPRKWTAFGAFATDDPLPDSSVLSGVPSTLRIGKRSVGGVSIEAGEHNWIGLEQVFGEFSEGKAAWIFGELVLREEQVLKIWSAADWWMDWYVDGIPVYNSLKSGNASTDYAYPNHSFRVRFSKGRHVIAVKVLSGSKGWGIASTAVRAKKQI